MLARERLMLQIATVFVPFRFDDYGQMMEIYRLNPIKQA
jgi:hypothetical protein